MVKVSALLIHVDTVFITIFSVCHPCKEMLLFRNSLQDG